jgi:DNA-binding MarR family transcriptional regulator
VAKKLSDKERYVEDEKLSSRAELVDEVRSAMRRLTTEIDGLDQRAANRFGINRTDLHLIDVLRSSGPLTASQLARAVGLSSGGLSIALDRLERIGYIRRSQHPDDRRSVIVEATDTLAPLEAAVFGALGKRMNQLLQTYSNDQLTTIKHYLESATAITKAATTPPNAEDQQPAPD